MFIINHRKIFFIISAVLVLAAWSSIAYFGFNLGADFTGGSILEVAYEDSRPEINTLRQATTELGWEQLVLQPAGEKGLLVRAQTLTEVEKDSLVEILASQDGGQLEEKRFSSIGPVIGSELARKGIIAIIVVAILIILYIAFVFRQVSRPVSSWKYGLIAVLALIHDVSIPTGVTVILGHYTGLEMNALFLTALLTILGLSVNDTIVVFDRVRENLRNKISPHFPEVVGRSLRQTIARSLITSLTLIFVLLAIYFYGGSTTRDFALIMALGMAVGTYSSIFLAAPLLVAWQGKTAK
ncbi:MAG: protein translocase subunit SecF [Patescibacteria group bacterium]|nr:protein translocase subunit SecF [Patescibacteria group bacterium]